MISICRSSILIWPLKFFALVFLAAPALAQEPVFFKPLENHPARATIMRPLEFAGNAPAVSALQIADIDLNNDGLTEALVKFPDGRIRLFALPPRRAAVMLGEIAPATGIQILDTHDYGVRRILTAGRPGNDFARQTYRWNPYDQRYEPEADSRP